MILLFLESLPHFCFQGVRVSLFIPSSMSQAEVESAGGVSQDQDRGFAFRGPCQSLGWEAAASQSTPGLCIPFPRGLHWAVPGSGATWVMRCRWLRVFSCI